MSDTTHNLFSLIGSDVRAKSQWMYGGDSTKLFLKTLAADGTATMILYRLMQASHKHHLAPLAMIFNKCITIFGQCAIGREADFGSAFVILYSNGVMINGHVRGGSHVTLTHQITIGEEHNRAPVLGNHVYIGAGARILGGVTIGDHTKIAANAVVLNHVPDGATVLGIPAQVVWRKPVKKPTLPAS
jgi:serine O-acetyltransferase